jgi:hypothetical protein
MRMPGSTYAHHKSMVFLSPSCIETAKNAVKTNRRKKWQGMEGKKSPELFCEKLLACTFSNICFGVFELLIFEKLTKTPVKQNGKHIFLKQRYLPHLVAICQIYVGFKTNLQRPLCTGVCRGCENDNSDECPVWHASVEPGRPVRGGGGGGPGIVDVGRAESR